MDDDNDQDILENPQSDDGQFCSDDELEGGELEPHLEQLIDLATD